MTFFNAPESAVRFADVIGGWSQLAAAVLTLVAILVARKQLILTRDQLKATDEAMAEQLNLMRRQLDYMQKQAVSVHQQTQQLLRESVPEVMLEIRMMGGVATPDNDILLEWTNIKQVPVYVAGVDVHCYWGRDLIKSFRVYSDSPPSSTYGIKLNGDKVLEVGESMVLYVPGRIFSSLLNEINLDSEITTKKLSLLIKMNAPTIRGRELKAFSGILEASFNVHEKDCHYEVSCSVLGNKNLKKFLYRCPVDLFSLRKE